MVPASSPQLVDVRLDCLQHSPTNPRTQFDATRHAELTTSIQAQGILVPLLCRPFGDLRLSDIHRPMKTLLDATTSIRTPSGSRPRAVWKRKQQTGSYAAITSITACTLRHHAARLYHHKMCSSFHVISMTTLNKEGI